MWSLIWLKKPRNQYWLQRTVRGLGSYEYWCFRKKRADTGTSCKGLTGKTGCMEGAERLAFQKFAKNMLLINIGRWTKIRFRRGSFLIPWRNLIFIHLRLAGGRRKRLLAGIRYFVPNRLLLLVFTMGKCELMRAFHKRPPQKSDTYILLNEVLKS